MYIDEVTIKLENNLNLFEVNGMCTNRAKFQIMFLGKKSVNNLYLNINGQVISKREDVKLHGVEIDNKLKFETHIKEICTRINQKGSAFRTVKIFLGEQKSQLLFNSVVMSNFSY